MSMGIYFLFMAMGVQNKLFFGTPSLQQFGQQGRLFWLLLCLVLHLYYFMATKLLIQDLRSHCKSMKHQPAK
ncbi:hypothetical protein REPUB_Repub11eG0060200 [Reevesia pubescens]